MTYGSLFTGIGGVDLGLDRAGMECRWQVEIDDYCVKVLKKHWPDVKRYGDITKVNGTELEPVDVICGGFPCQDLSQAGKRVGIEGTRSGLWFEYARLVRELRPRYVLIENVPGLLVFDAMRRVVGELARLGYVGCWRSLRASEFGASHLRKRVFIVAYRDGAGLETRDELAGPGSTASGQPRSRSTALAYCPDNGRGISGAAHNDDGRDALRNITNGRDPHVAHGTVRGLGELWQPPWSDGLPDGSDEELAHTGIAGGGRREEHAPGERRGELRDGGEELAHASTARQAGQQDSRADSGDEGEERRRRIEPERGSGILAHTKRAERGQDNEHQQLRGGREQAPDRIGSDSGDLADAERQHDRAEEFRSKAGGPEAERSAGRAGRSGGQLADTGNRLLPQQGRGPQGRDGPGSAGADVLGNTAGSREDLRPTGCGSRSSASEPGGQLEDAYCAGLEIRDGNGCSRLQIPSLAAGLPAFAPGPSDPRWPTILRERPDLAPAVESQIRRVADGIPDQLDRAMSNRTKRLGRLGNAVVPDCAEWIGQKILEFEGLR